MEDKPDEIRSLKKLEQGQNEKPGTSEEKEKEERNENRSLKELEEGLNEKPGTLQEKEKEEPDENRHLNKLNQGQNEKPETLQEKEKDESDESRSLKKLEEGLNGKPETLQEEQEEEPDESRSLVKWEPGTLEQLQSTESNAAEEEEKTDEQSKTQQTLTRHQCFISALGWVALCTGCIYLHTFVCPWSPNLPAFLVAFGFVNNLAPLVTSIVLCFCCCAPDKRKARASAYVGHLFLIAHIGLVVWGFFLLYSNPEEVTYTKFQPNSTVVNQNYCNGAVYLVPVIITWLAAIEFIIVFILIALVALACRMAMKMMLSSSDSSKDVQ